MDGRLYGAMQMVFFFIRRKQTEMQAGVRGGGETVSAAHQKYEDQIKKKGERDKKRWRGRKRERAEEEKKKREILL